MCKCFIRGLKPDIEQRIARDLDVQATVADALRIERELRDITDLRQGQNNNSEKNRLRETCQICYKEGHSASACRKLTQQSYNKSPLGTEILICQICKKRGHSADKCQLRDPQTRQSVNIVQESSIICQLCSKIGHNAKACRMNNNNEPYKPSIICQWCDKPGHSANNCWKKQNEQRNVGNKLRVTCQICNNIGHIAKDCRSKTEQNKESKNSVFCR
ncbi:PREDICTED: cellular nucleic acid-binding protein homolog [Vollenhovia emeryi]|uniref:cellular nucleic acid-binding protein homolog n=1 Tax=Vollenhovia emeryi TaxID=411798 RepID=UPI0005F53622|nr:PREDICTED: cellular nucleic acid-binding protein homolog [Vollenhovia emeryi]